MISDKFKNYLFDLDGTLIDSKQSIISSLEHAFKSKDIDLNLTNEKNIIGPPLDVVLKKLDPHNDKRLQEELRQIFIDYYDNIAFKNTKIAKGVSRLLKELLESNKNIIIVTNKRHKPTLKIIQLFECLHGIHDFYSIDSFKNLTSKNLIIKKVIAIKELKKEETVYIGDTFGDFEAAKDNKIDFIRVCINNAGFLEVLKESF